METPHSDKIHSPPSSAVGCHLPPILSGTWLALVATSADPEYPKHKDPPGALQLPQTTLQNKWKIPSVSWEVSYRYHRWLPRVVQWKPMLQAPAGTWGANTRHHQTWFLEQICWPSIPGAEVWTYYFGPCECINCDPCGVQSEEAIALLQLLF